MSEHIPARLSVLTNHYCYLCGGHLRALRNMDGVGSVGQARVSPPTYVCPECDGMGSTANG